jgi:hypothetical protein
MPSQKTEFGRQVFCPLNGQKQLKFWLNFQVFGHLLLIEN